MEIKSLQHRLAPQPLFLILAIWLISFVTWTLPDRAVPSSVGGLDLLALAKVGIRGAFLVLIGWTVACYMRLASARKRAWLHWPLCLFVGWCIVSIAWSPLKAISLGQALGQLLLLLISINVALCCRNPDYQSKILFQLCLMSVTFSLLVMLLHYVFPDWATLDREEYLGLFHPTNVASTASTGLLLLLACALVLYRNCVWQAP